MIYIYKLNTANLPNGKIKVVKQTNTIIIELYKTPNAVFQDAILILEKLDNNGNYF